MAITFAHLYIFNISMLIIYFIFISEQGGISYDQVCDDNRGDMLYGGIMLYRSGQAAVFLQRKL